MSNGMLKNALGALMVGVVIFTIFCVVSIGLSSRGRQAGEFSERIAAYRSGEDPFAGQRDALDADPASDIRIATVPDELRGRRYDSRSTSPEANRGNETERIQRTPNIDMPVAPQVEQHRLPPLPPADNESDQRLDRLESRLDKLIELRLRQSEAPRTAAPSAESFHAQIHNQLTELRIQNQVELRDLQRRMQLVAEQQREFEHSIAQQKDELKETLVSADDAVARRFERWFAEIPQRPVMALGNPGFVSYAPVVHGAMCPHCQQQQLHHRQTFGVSPQNSKQNEPPQRQPLRPPARIAKRDELDQRADRPRRTAEPTVESIGPDENSIWQEPVAPKHTPVPLPRTPRDDAEYRDQQTERRAKDLPTPTPVATEPKPIQTSATPTAPDILDSDVDRDTKTQKSTPIPPAEILPIGPTAPISNVATDPIPALPTAELTDASASPVSEDNCVIPKLDLPALEPLQESVTESNVVSQVETARAVEASKFNQANIEVADSGYTQSTTMEEEKIPLVAGVVDEPVSQITPIEFSDGPTNLAGPLPIDVSIPIDPLAVRMSVIHLSTDDRTKQLKPRVESLEKFTARHGGWAAGNHDAKAAALEKALANNRNALFVTSAETAFLNNLAQFAIGSKCVHCIGEQGVMPFDRLLVRRGETTTEGTRFYVSGRTAEGKPIRTIIKNSFVGSPGSHFVIIESAQSGFVSVHKKTSMAKVPILGDMLTKTETQPQVIQRIILLSILNHKDLKPDTLLPVPEEQESVTNKLFP